MAGPLRPGHAAPGHAASTAHSRSRSRAHTTATAATAATPKPADNNPGSGSPAGLAAAAAWLAGAGTGGGGALSSRLATAVCREVAQGALQQYTAAAPPRYPERVHYAAVAAVVAALRAKTPPGPAASAASAWLHAACEDEWRRVAGRQQCSALSATGRPCTRPLHVSEPEALPSIAIYCHLLPCAWLRCDMHAPGRALCRTALNCAPLRCQVKSLNLQRVQFGANGPKAYMRLRNVSLP